MELRILVTRVNFVYVPYEVRKGSSNSSEKF
jgi:hypothetical protein